MSMSHPFPSSSDGYGVWNDRTPNKRPSSGTASHAHIPPRNTASISSSGSIGLYNVGPSLSMTHESPRKSPGASRDGHNSSNNGADDALETYGRTALTFGGVGGGLLAGLSLHETLRTSMTSSNGSSSDLNSSNDRILQYPSTGSRLLIDDDSDDHALLSSSSLSQLRGASMMHPQHHQQQAVPHREAPSHHHAAPVNAQRQLFAGPPSSDAYHQPAQHHHQQPQQHYQQQQPQPAARMDHRADERRRDAARMAADERRLREQHRQEAEAHTNRTRHMMEMDDMRRMNEEHAIQHHDAQFYVPSNDEPEHFRHIDMLPPNIRREPISLLLPSHHSTNHSGAHHGNHGNHSHGGHKSSAPMAVPASRSFSSFRPPGLNMSTDGSTEFVGNPVRGGAFIPPPQRRTPSPPLAEGQMAPSVGAPLSHRHHSAPPAFHRTNDNSESTRDQHFQLNRRASPPLPHGHLAHPHGGNHGHHSPVDSSPSATGGWMSRGESPRFSRSFTPPYGYPEQISLEEKGHAGDHHHGGHHSDRHAGHHHGGGGGGHDHYHDSMPSSANSSRGHSPIGTTILQAHGGPSVAMGVPTPTASSSSSSAASSSAGVFIPPAPRRPSVPRVVASTTGPVGSAPVSPRLPPSSSSLSQSQAQVQPPSPSTPRTRRLTPPALGRSMSGSVASGPSSSMGMNQGPSSSSSMPESPMHKSRFRDFYRDFWAKARTDPEAAHSYGTRAVDTFPESMQYRLCMEIADLAKRQNKIRRARKWYKQVHRLEPTAAQGWLEHAKMEEECGELIKCQRLLRMGLVHCQYNESLLVKAIKHEERLGDLEGARCILAQLKEVHIDKVWRTVLEGALLEARAGQLPTARRVFKYLMKHVSWYGPVYHEACRFEEKQHEFERACTVVDRGLIEVPKYGPLWFTALRLYERTCHGNLTKPREIVHRAVKAISSELVWKIHFESAQMEENAGHYDRSRLAFAESVRHCPKNLRWKAWLSGARMELRAGRIDVARMLLARGLDEAPKKMRATVHLELSRLEEFVGNVAQARAILQRTQKEAGCEWKVFLESVLLELRCSNIDGAIVAAESALKCHSATGRLWAVLIQLKQRDGEAEQLRVFREAIKEVPKSGEVWCEGARISLNPTSKHFSLRSARKFLIFAVQFTPQYGDSFVEYLRLKLLIEGIDDETSFNRVKQLCINADPNYGQMWFFCKKTAADTPGEVLATARSSVLDEIMAHQSLYQQAIMSCMARPPSTPDHTSSSSAASTPPTTPPSSFKLTASALLLSSPAPSHNSSSSAAVSPCSTISTSPIPDDDEDLSSWPFPDSASTDPLLSAFLGLTVSSHDNTDDAPSSTSSHATKVRTMSMESSASSAPSPSLSAASSLSSTGSYIPSPMLMSASYPPSPATGHTASSLERKRSSSSSSTLALPPASYMSAAVTRSMYHGTMTSGNLPITRSVSGMSSSGSSTYSSGSTVSNAWTAAAMRTSPGVVKEWQSNNLNALHRLYPDLRTLTPDERHKVLFSADPITP